MTIVPVIVAIIGIIGGMLCKSDKPSIIIIINRNRVVKIAVVIVAIRNNTNNNEQIIPAIL